MAELHLLFPTPLYETQLPFRPKEFFEMVKILEELEWKQDVDFLGRSNGSVTQVKNVLELPGMEKLRDMIMKEVEVYLYDVLSIARDIHKIHCVTAWSNRYQDQCYAVKHWHSNALFSGVFYPRVNDPEEGGEIQFFRSGPTWSTDDWEININDVTDLNTHVKVFEPQEGTLYLFPSHLSHMVNPIRTKSDGPVRYSIAFNFMLDGEFGERHSTKQYSDRYGYGTNYLNLKI